MNWVLIGVMLYILATLAVGAYASRRTKTEADYLLAGRRLPFSVATMTIFATWFGAETCIGASGAVYKEGLPGARMDPFGYMLCLVFMGLFFAIPFYKLKITTLADLFRLRYSGGVERLAAILLIPTSVIWAAAQISAFGHIVAASSDFSLPFTITAAAAVVIVYTAWGGIMADAVTDVVQGLVLILGLVLLLGIILWSLADSGELAGVMEAIRLTPGEGEGETFGVSLEAWAIPIFGSVIAQELVARTLASKSPSVARNSVLAAAGVYLCVGFIPLTIGLLGQGILPGLKDSEQLLPLIAQQYLHGALYTIFIGALISAILSTVDSALLAASALCSHNVVLPLLKNPSERTKVLTARIAVVSFGVSAYVMAMYAEGVKDLVETASAFGTAGIFIVVVFALFTRFGGIAAAYATLSAGIGTYIFALFVLESDTPYLMSLSAALIAYVGVGLIERVTGASTDFSRLVPVRSEDE